MIPKLLELSELHYHSTLKKIGRNIAQVLYFVRAMMMQVFNGF